MDLQRLEPNERLATKGRLIKMNEGDDVAFLIASNSSARYRQVLRDLIREAGQRRVARDAELSDKVVKQAMARAILLGWEGELSYGGKKLDPKKVEDRERVLEVKPILEFVAEECSDLNNFKAEAEAEEAEAVKSDG